MFFTFKMCLFVWDIQNKCITLNEKWKKKCFFFTFKICLFASTWLHSQTACNLYSTCLREICHDIWFAYKNCHFPFNGSRIYIIHLLQYFLNHDSYFTHIIPLHSYATNGANFGSKFFMNIGSFSILLWVKHFISNVIL